MSNTLDSPSFRWARYTQGLCLASTTVLCLGCWTLSASAEETTPESWRIIRAAGPDLAVIGRLRTRTAGQIESTPWSVGCETLDRDYTVYDNYRAYVGPLGAKAARIQAGWGKCEKVKGQYDWAWLDHVIDDLNAQGVRPWVCICYGNEIYEGGGTRLLGGKLPSSDEALAAWQRWVETMANRYKGRVFEWEVWNEPEWGYSSRMKEELRAERLGQYVTMYLRTAETIRAIDPKAKMWAVAACHPRALFIPDFLEAMSNRDKLHLVDAITYHAYTVRPEDHYPGVEVLRQTVARYSDRIEIRQGESGCPSVRHEVHALSKQPWTEFNQPKWYLRRMLGDRVRGIPPSVFAIVDIRYPNVLLSMGLLRANDQKEVLYKKPAYYAVQHLMSILDGTAHPMKQVEFKAAANPDLQVAGFTKGGGSLVFVWKAPPGIPSDDLAWTPIELTLETVASSDPVYVELMSGNVYELDAGRWRTSAQGTVFTELPVRDSPILIAERATVDLNQ
ncbi:MAG TPA: hypothetical protein VMY37_39755 [Thermoguttaceae bacterium]|nr:hypothetical protein [Thermoguttaceae bacterium]